jgi:uncharacterized RDD family membrane protein YckC
MSTGAPPKFCSNCAAPLQPGTAFCPKCGAPVSQTSGFTGAPLSGVDSLIKEPGAQNYWLKRVLAFGIDFVIVAVILVVVAVFVAIPTFVFSGTAGLTSLFAGVFSVLAGVVLFLYFIVAEVTRGATVGKVAMRLRVVGPNGGNPTLFQSLVRNLSKIYWVLLLLDVVLGLATSKQYTQKLSDRLVGTSVIQ